MSPEFAAFQARFNQATDASLVAAATVFHGAIREKLQRGYTTGNFVTGATASSVVQDPEPYDGPAGRQISVGTPELVALYWELGHHNILTRKFERVEYWRDTLVEKRDEMAAMFAAEMHTRLEVRQ